MIERGKRHFGETYGSPYSIHFGKKVYPLENNVSTDLSKLEITKHGKVKV